MKGVVHIANFSPPDAIITFLKILHESGLTNPILRGGALRDFYLCSRQGLNIIPRDLDITADFGGVIPDYLDRPSDTPNRLQAHIKNIFPSSVIHRLPQGLDGDENSGYIGCGIDFTLPGLPISEDAGLYLSNNGQRYADDFERCIMLADAPINSIAMKFDGTGKPEVFAHPDFEAHAQNRIYAPVNNGLMTLEIAEARYKKLSDKIEGLSRHGFSELPTEAASIVEQASFSSKTNAPSLL